MFSILISYVQVDTTCLMVLSIQTQTTVPSGSPKQK